MNHRNRNRNGSRQRGFSLLSMIFVGGVIVVVSLVGMQVAPTVMEFFTIQKAIQKASQSGGGTVQEIRTAFDRMAQIDNITSVTGQDLEITKAGEKVVISFAYQKEIALTGPAYLLLKYKGTTR